VNNLEAQQAEARAKAERLCLAYARVLGQDDANRTEDQRLVMADFEHRGYINRSTMVPDQGGGQCEHRITSAEGQRIFVLNTKELIRRANVTAQKPKPTVRKKA
jgi:hypothetical protein